MSNQHQSSSYSTSSSSYTTSSFSTSSSSSTNPPGQEHSRTYTETINSNTLDGTNIRRTTQETGRPTLQDEMYIPPGGGGQIGSGTVETGGGGTRRIEDLSDMKDEDGDEEQKRRDREYEERMEEEYAKREGGA